MGYPSFYGVYYYTYFYWYSATEPNPNYNSCFNFNDGTYLLGLTESQVGTCNAMLEESWDLYREGCP